MKNTVLCLLFVIVALFSTLCVYGQQRKVQHRPYIDQRRFHYGFLVGLNLQDYEFVNTNAITADGEQWYADVPNYEPGFSVGVLGELYLTKHLALRLLPSLHFGGRNIYFNDYLADDATAATTRRIQQTKSTLLSIPLDLKFSAPRFNNYRPYLMAGVNPVYDLNIRNGDALRFRPLDCFLEVGLGCDYYLPFFKFIPEIKFCFGLNNLINKDRDDLLDQSLGTYRDAVSSATGKMIVLTFHFE